MTEDIVEFQRRARKLSPRTRQLYAEHLRKFCAWCTEQGIGSWDDLTADQVEDYLAAREACWAPSTRWSAICAIRKFVRWRYGDKHPVCAVTIDRPDNAPQRTLNAKEADALLALFDTGRPKGVRDLAIVTLMLDTGLRAAELVSIDLRHLDMEEGVVWTVVKGGEWEPAAFYEYSRSCLARWLAVRDTVVAPGVTTLFVSIGGLTPGYPITRDGLRAIFRRFSIHSELGLVSPHALRRTFATLACAAGAPTRVVQVSGRWKHIRQVERYTRALRAKQLHRWSPVNRLMGVPYRRRRDDS